MKHIFFLPGFFILSLFYSNAQTIQLESEKTTRAVVIGISDYQSEDIPDLQYADRDAEAFVTFLKSSAGGNLNTDNIKLLTNKKATTGGLVKELDWLIDESKEGDIAIIYFSGHGDVEKKYLGDPGYLLTWDSPPRSYMAGAFSIANLEIIISTLSLENKAKVIVITGACRAGNLAGEKIGGAQLSNANLAKQFANETKILSCQHDEYSIEGEQWGEGRGVFSYHLIEGLYGFADKNNDSKVTLSEIDRYLEDKVTVEAKPHIQNPMTIGNKTEQLSNVDQELLDNLQEYKKQSVISFSKIDQKGFVNEVLSSVDSNIVTLYYAFQKAMENKQFFEPKASCADTLYSQLIEVPELEPLYSHMRRNYAAALQDDAQQVINRMLFQPEKEAGIWISPSRMRLIYGNYPKMLDRAAELLGNDHYMYPVLKARQLFFEGSYISLKRIRLKDKLNGEKAIKKFRESLKWQPNSPHTFYFMANTFLWNLEEIDSAYYYIQKAIEYAPAWRLPLYSYIADLSHKRYFNEAKALLDNIDVVDSTNIHFLNALFAYNFFIGQFERSYEYGNLIMTIDSSAYYYYTGMIQACGFLGQKEKALEIFNYVIQYDSLTPFPHYYLGSMYYLKGEYENAISCLDKALSLDSSFIWPYSLIGDSYLRLEKHEEAELVLLAGYDKDSTYMPLVNALGGVYAGKEELTKAVYFYKKAIDYDDSNMLPYYNLAMVQSKQNNIMDALRNLEIFLQKGGTIYYDHIQTNTDLDPLRELPEYKELMKKYFPEKIKD